MKDNKITEDMPEQTEIETIGVPRNDYEIITRQAQIYQLVCTVNLANQKIGQLEREIGQLQVA